jgi:hypothetical protein
MNQERETVPRRATPWQIRLGWILSGLALLFLAMDATMKLLALPIVLEAGAQIGFVGAGLTRALGLILMACTLLYAFPRTSLLGAILLTGYLGGAVATHVRLGNPLLSHVLFGVYIGVIVWAGIVLREPRLRVLLRERP